MLIRQTLLYLPAQFLSPAAQLVAILLWTWWLPPEEMSAYVLVTATQDLAYLFAVSWFSNYTLRFLPGLGDDGGRSRFLDSETTILALLTPVQVLIAALSALMFDLGDDYWIAVLTMSAFFLTRSLNTHYGERARAEGAILAYTLLQTVGPIGGMLLGYLALASFGGTAVHLLSAYSLAQLAGTLLALPMIGLSIRLRRPDPVILKAALAYGGPMLALAMLSWLAENNIRYLVEWTAGAGAFGLMAVGWGLGRRAMSVAAMLMAAAAFPLAARLFNENRGAEALRQLSVNAALLLGLLVPSVAGLAVVGPQLVQLTVAEDYRATTTSLLALSGLAGALRYFHLHTTDQLFVLTQRFSYAALISLIEIFGTILLAGAGLYLGGATSAGGIYGAVAGATLASFLATLTSLVFATRREGFRFPLPDFIRILIATAAMSALLVNVDLGPGVASLVVDVVAGIIGYGAVLGLLYLPHLRNRRLRQAS